MQIQLENKKVEKTLSQKTRTVCLFSLTADTACKWSKNKRVMASLPSGVSGGGQMYLIKVTQTMGAKKLKKL